MTGTDSRAAKLHIFISYSRDDLAFADQLEAALAIGHFSATLDRKGVSGGEEWKARLSSLIRNCDAVVFVLSPSSASSDICSWEVHEARSLSKRIIPVICRPLEGAKPPAELAELNYIFFYPEPRMPGSGFGLGLTQLATALETDLAWVREHTRLLLRATEWREAGKFENRLLSGSDVSAAKSWVECRPKGAPEATSLHLDFIRASEEGEKARTDAARLQLAERERLLREAEVDRKAREEALSRAQSALNETVQMKRREAWVASITLAVLGAVGWWGSGLIREQRDVSRESNREDLCGQMIAYATAHGEWEFDRAPGHETSPYTTPLVRNLMKRNRSISELLLDTHEEVRQFAKELDPFEENGSNQRPLYSTSMNGRVYLWKQPKNRKKHALVISAPLPGVQEYNKITGPIHDTNAIAGLLQKAGYASHEITFTSSESSFPPVNPTVSEIEGVLTRIGSSFRTRSSAPSTSSPPDNTLLFIFFSGHGLSIGGVDYIMTNLGGISIRDREQIKTKALPVDRLKSQAEEIAAASIIILDTHFPDLEELISSVSPR